MNTNPATIRTADTADVIAAGRPFPRPAPTGHSHASAVALFRARRAFWLAAAEQYLGEGAAYDAREALAQADLYAPRSAA